MKTILFVDDDDEDIEFFKNGCEAGSFENIAFYNDVDNVIKVLSSLQNQELPALIVTDCNMPKNCGSDLIEFIKSQQRFSAIKTAVISSGFSNHEIESFKNLGVEEVLLKPTNLREYQKLCVQIQELAGKA